MTLDLPLALGPKIPATGSNDPVSVLITLTLVDRSGSAINERVTLPWYERKLPIVSSLIITCSVAYMHNEFKYYEKKSLKLLTRYTFLGTIRARYMASATKPTHHHLTETAEGTKAVQGGVNTKHSSESKMAEVLVTQRPECIIWGKPTNASFLVYQIYQNQKP